MVGGEGCALEGSRVCARTSHPSPIYIVAACPPVASLPTRHLVLSPHPRSRSLLLTPPCVICPPWRVPRAVSSAPASRRPPPRRPPACPPSCCPPALPSQPRRPPAPPCRLPAPLSCRPPAPLPPTRPSSRRPSPTSLLGPSPPRHMMSRQTRPPGTCPNRPGTRPSSSPTR